MTRIAVGKAREHFGDTLDRVTSKGDRVILQRRGKDVAVLVSIEEMRRLEEILEELQDQLDAAEAVRIIAEMEAKGEKPIPYEKIRKELGLK